MYPGEVTQWYITARVGSTRQAGHARAPASAKPTSVRTERLAELSEIAVDRIQLPREPAWRFVGDIASLAASMQDYGLQQPISAPLNGDKYILTSGFRRLTAAQTLG